MKLAKNVSRPAAFAAALLVLSLVWTLDVITPHQLNIVPLYLLPVGLATWFCRGRWGYVMAVLCTALWLWHDVAGNVLSPHWSVHTWNAVSHLSVFVLMAAMVEMIERMRRLGEQEREMSRLKSDLISLVSHEFANSLTTLKLTLTILREATGPDAEAERQKCYAILDRAYAHLNDSVTNFLNLNRIEAGRFVPHPKTVHLRTLIHSVISRMGPAIEESGVALRLDFPEHSVMVQTDPDALTVIMSNLIGNAFKYTPPGGQVTVSIKFPDGVPFARVAVEDTGIGIATGDHAKVASGFYRAENGKSVAMGFGVGLKVSRDLLESQGSSLEIESTPGKGSKFSFRLPLQSAPLSAAAQAPSTAPPRLPEAPLHADNL